ncbi:hypothetical protein Sliba_70400 [Streptomyces nigrescens]|uniref:Uncharacterized protein n=1 Tax=Streptomyces nigrescens TaxID=1920 RepID=A0A640TSI7_STRNI|nr:hypothetical protein Sliba_70400 [Streptomyces libani subsp. libani]GGW00926.1 hypothetical protein GCM10010500_54890 [Streptomyces libani subsp. libani]
MGAVRGRTVRRRACGPWRETISLGAPERAGKAAVEAIFPSAPGRRKGFIRGRGGRTEDARARARPAQRSGLRHLVLTDD